MLIKSAVCVSAFLFLFSFSLKNPSVFLLIHQYIPARDSISLLVRNPQTMATRVFAAADNEAPVIGELPPGEYAQYQGPGMDGRWHYIRMDEGLGSVHDSRVDLGHYAIAGRILDNAQLHRVARYSGNAFVALFIVALLRSRSRRFPVDKVQALIDDAHRRERFVAERELRHQYQKFTLREHTLKDRIAEQEYEFSQMHSTLSRERELRADFEDKIKRLLQQQVQAELENTPDITHHPSIEFLQTAYTQLESKYRKAIADAKTFGIDLMNEDFENLLKGRLFEIHIVHLFNTIPDLVLLEWTPDKGFDHDIYVKANGHPDLVYEWRGKKQFAIECKYRTKPEDYYAYELGTGVCWASDKCSGQVKPDTFL